MQSVRLIKHEAVPKCGSFEVRYAGWQASRERPRGLLEVKGIRQGRHEVKEAAFSWRPP